MTLLSLRSQLTSNYHLEASLDSPQSAPPSTAALSRAITWSLFLSLELLSLCEIILFVYLLNYSLSTSNCQALLEALGYSNEQDA